jgi:hypothetical protein
LTDGFFFSPQRTGVRMNARVLAPRFDRSWMRSAFLMSTFVALGELLAIRAGASGLPSAPWLQVREQTVCEAMQDDYCLGRYGFAIAYSGAFVAGPSDRGIKTEGRIEPQELQRLRDLIIQTSSSLQGEGKSCQPEGLPGIRDRVEITFSGGEVVRVYDLGGKVGTACYVGNWHRVRELHEYLHSLMARYYPVPFPNK